MTARRQTARAPRALTRDESSVDRLYLELRDRAMRYDFRPGSRINEQALGRELDISRPPLREALNRLAAEGLLDFVMNKGFFRKSISVDEVMDLYQVRIALERRAVMLAVQRASDAQIAAVAGFWAGIRESAAQMPTADLLLADEEFHRRLIALSGNRELAAIMENVTRRIHSARHIDIEQSAWNSRAFAAHDEVIRLIAERRTEEALQAITEHIDMSQQRAIAITRELAAKFFLQQSPAGPPA